MSADNGIYILQTKSYMEWSEDGIYANPLENHRYYYRVAHAMAIANMDWYKENQPENVGTYMIDVWGKSPRFKTLQEAKIYALNPVFQHASTEYGIVEIDMSNYVFFFDG